MQPGIPWLKLWRVRTCILLKPALQYHSAQRGSCVHRNNRYFCPLSCCGHSPGGALSVALSPCPELPGLAAAVDASGESSPGVLSSMTPSLDSARLPFSEVCVCVGGDVTLPNLATPFYAVFKEPELLRIVRMVIGWSNGQG